MTMFKKFTGSYTSLLNTLKPLQIYSASFRPQTKEEYLGIVQRDLNRIRYFDDEHSILEMQQRLRMTHHLYDEIKQQLRDPQKTLSYSQGDFFGATFAQSLVSSTEEFVDSASSENHHERYDSLGFCYIDETGANCGITITYFSPPNQISTDESLPFVISIIRNTNGAPDERESTCLIHPALMKLTPFNSEIEPKDVLAQEQEIEDIQLNDELKKTLHSKAVETFLDGLIEGGAISKQRFGAIKEDLNRRFDQHLEKTSTLSDLFDVFLKSCPLEQASLFDFKDAILAQTLFNLRLDKKELYSSEESHRILHELTQVIRFHSQLPSLIGKNSDDSLEDPTEGMDIDKINTHNLFKHLTRGTPLVSQDGAHYSESFLAHPDIWDNFFVQRNPRLMKCFREELQILFDNAWQHLENGSLTDAGVKQYEIFQANLLSSYPFWDPEEDETVRLPQKINDVWQLVTYKFKRFDISPSSGPLSSVLEAQDRMYAYVLEPQDNLNALSHLLLMGTTYPAGQGAGLAVVYNFAPDQSVGEGHDMSQVNDWLLQQRMKSVNITGHSKGAAMAMMMAAQYPEQVVQADCLNPPALCEATLERLSPTWKAQPRGSRPHIHVYAQQGDPAFPLEKGFLEGTELYRLVSKATQPAMNVSGPFSIPLPEAARRAYEAHIHIFSGRSDLLVLNINPNAERLSLARVFFHDIKKVLNWLRFPLEYMELYVTILARKLKHFYLEYQTYILTIGAMSVLLGGTLLVLSGVLMPLIASVTAPLLMQLGMTLSSAMLQSITAVAIVISPLLVYCALDLTRHFTVFTLNTIQTLLLLTAHLTAIIVGSGLFAIKQSASFLGYGVKESGNESAAYGCNRGRFFATAPAIEKTLSGVTAPLLDEGTSSELQDEFECVLN